METAGSSVVFEKTSEISTVIIMSQGMKEAEGAIAIVLGGALTGAWGFVLRLDIRIY